MKKVVKFGGTSLADSKQFEKVKNIILSDSSRVYVVPSAPGKRNNNDIKITDLLYKCYDLAKNGKNFSEEFALIQERYNGIIKDLNLDLDLTEEFSKIEVKLLNEPERIFERAYNGELFRL